MIEKIEPANTPTLEIAGHHLPLEISGEVEGTRFSVRIGGPPVEIETPSWRVRITPRVGREGFAVGVSADLVEERMPEKIESVLSAEDVQMLTTFKRDELRGCVRYLAGMDPTERDAMRAIAFANAGLPDGNRRKITREKIAAVRDAAEVFDDEYGHREERRAVARLAMQFADALESSLPPEA